jgi:hypothetical protein
MRLRNFTDKNFLKSNFLTILNFLKKISSGRPPLLIQKYKTRSMIEKKFLNPIKSSPFPTIKNDLTISTIKAGKCCEKCP